MADLIRIEASVLELRRVDFFRWLKEAPLLEIEETWESGSIIDLQISVTRASFAVGEHLWANHLLSPFSLVVPGESRNGG